MNEVKVIVHGRNHDLIGRRIQAMTVSEHGIELHTDYGTFLIPGVYNIGEIVMAEKY